jgi:hypothetical protein
VYGSYLFNEDTIGLMPQYTVNGMVSFTRNTERFGITAAAYSTLVGSHNDINHGYQDPYSLMGCFATIRFITLSLTARVDNLLDTDHAFYPEYPLMNRAFTVSAQWQFWY